MLKLLVTLCAIALWGTIGFLMCGWLAMVLGMWQPLIGVAALLGAFALPIYVLVSANDVE